MQVVDNEMVYHTPGILVIQMQTEGILCLSNEIPDWEQNEDVL